MKKTLLFILVFLFIILKPFAQPILTSATNTPHIGESFASQFAKSTNVNSYAGGANQTWDYSGLQDSAAGYRFQVVVPSSTPYADSFPGSNLALKTNNDSAYVYFNSQSDKLWEVGAAASDTVGVLRYSPPKIYLPYPFTYNSSFTDSVAYITNVGGLRFVLAGRDSLLGEGYGILKIPGKSLSNVLRVKYIENVRFDTVLLGTGIKSQIRVITYIYFAPDTHAPLLSYAISASHISSSILGIPISDTTTFDTSISYLRSFTLPVTFAAFNVSINNKEVDLKWQTGQEINANTFNVQRSLTGNDYADIAQVTATGKSTGAIYNYTDLDFVKSDIPPTAYYRIKEIDKDGKEFYSTTAIIHGNANMVRLYPNPAKDYLNFNIKDATVADAISVYDAKGHLVQQYKNYQISKPINVANLSKGTYFIQVKIKDKTTTSTVVKE